jgi:molybdopterin-guanine dinucleotide biosynthesis protein A
MREKQILGVILAGGAGRRFGADKRVALLAGKPLLEWVIARAQPQVATLVVNANAEIAIASHVDRLPDDAPREGPLAGILAGLKRAEEDGYSHVATFACDTPFFPRDTVAHLAEMLHGSRADYAVARCGPTVHRIIALWPLTCRRKLATAFSGGARSMRSIEACLSPASADFPPEGGPDGDPFFNINTAADLQNAEEWLSKHSPESWLPI